jgi:hypothetical protein
MREFCLTEEVIQQFVDGELSPERTEDAAAHLAACDDCAQLLDEVEQGNALLMEAFAPEMSLSVPTLRMRERLDAAIAGLEPQPRALRSEATVSSGLRHWFGSLFGSFSFTPQQAFGFASIAVVVAFAAIFAVIQLRQKQDTPAATAGTQAPSTVSPVSTPVVEKPTPEVANVSATPDVNQGIRTGSRPASSNRRLERFGNTVAKRVEPKDVQSPNQPSPAPKLLPGEKGYLEAIASLTTAIDTNKDDVLKPAVRADYERNLAVVDQAIASTRQQAKRNPNDRDAAEFMYTAYQNKIELLSAVADQTRVASR